MQVLIHLSLPQRVGLWQYEGGTEFGRFHGQGVLTMADGTRYEGEFENGQFHGRGTLFFPEGKLEGQWEKGKVSGHHKLDTVARVQ